MKTQTIILETGYTGHRREYISHLMKFINFTPQLHGKYIFILNEQMESLLRDLALSVNYKIQFFKFENQHANSIKRSFQEWKIIVGFIKEVGNVSKIIFMDIDPYFVLLATRKFNRLNLKVSGILFQPFIHFNCKGNGSLFYIKQYVKPYVLQKLSVIINKKIENLFILNDKDAVDAMNKKVKKIYRFLADPIDYTVQNIDKPTYEKIMKKYSLQTDNKNLLSFGSIDDRKNLINIIRSILLLPANERQSIHFIIAGKFNSKIKEEYIDFIEKSRSELKITYYDEYVNDQEREVLFTCCDLVLMPYINYYSSSGILGHAVKHQKQVVASNQGLVGRLVAEHKLGRLVDPYNVTEIRDAISSILTNNGSQDLQNIDFRNQFNPVNFSRVILLS